MSEKLFPKHRTGPVILISRKIEFTFPLSYAYLAGYLKHLGEDVDVMFRPAPAQSAAFVTAILKKQPLLVGFGSLYPELAEIKQLIQLFDEAGRDFPIVIGGQMVSPIPEFAVAITGADFGVIGEGEISLYQLVTALRQGRSPEHVNGLVIRDGDAYRTTGAGAFIEDLDQLPPIPYEFFPTNEWLNIGEWYAKQHSQPHWRFADRVINVHGGRGCPFTCNFCYHHSRPRYRSMHIAMAEAAETLERFNGNMLYFSDETTLHSPARVKEMLTEINNLKRRVEYSVSSRFDILDRIDDTLLHEMKATGCRIMGLGIESGSDRILKIIGKKFSAETILRGLERLKNVGILPTVSIMIGQYTETVDDVEASIKLMQTSVRMNPNIQYAFTIATPFPGSQLYRYIFEHGLLQTDRDFYDRYFQTGQEFQSVVNLSQMTNQEIQTLYDKIQRIYWEEKSRHNSRNAARVEALIRKIAFGHERFEQHVVQKLRQHPALKDNRGLSILDTLQRRAYESIQIQLDHLRLQLRHIPGTR